MGGGRARSVPGPWLCHAGSRSRRRRLPGRPHRARPNIKRGLRGGHDARTGVPLGMPRGAMCVQRLDDSLNSAIRITYRISLRSSSMPEPRDPLLKVLSRSLDARTAAIAGVARSSGGRGPRGRGARAAIARRSNRRVHRGLRRARGDPSRVTVMILPQVHLRNGCLQVSLEARLYLKRAHAHPLPLSL